MFGDDEVSTVVAPLGYNVVEGTILRGDGRPARCENCQDRLTTKTLGFVIKGSFKLFCEDPTCVMDHFEAKFES